MIVRLNVSNFRRSGPVPGQMITAGPEGAIKDMIVALMDRQFTHDTLKIHVGLSEKPETVEAVFEDPMEAAIFLATISADPERAALFKMFWSGE